MATLDIATPDHTRQDVLVAKAVVTFGTGNDIATTGTVTAINVPAGAIVIGGFVNVSDATSASVDIHVQSAALAVYVADIDGAATGVTALVPTGYQYTTSDTIDVMVDTASAAADGQMELYVEYIVDGRSAFVQK